jgi:hypothetical protein
MPRHLILRVWLEDRPGSLGRLASQVGELGADLTGIDILDHRGGQAADELTVELPDGVGPDELVEAISALEGVEVEDVRLLASRRRANERDPLAAAVALASSRSAEELTHVLARSARTGLDADWVVVLRPVGEQALVASAGSPPSAEWLASHAESASSGAAPGEVGIGPRDLASARLPSAGLVVLLGRDGRPLLSRERLEFADLCRVADALWWHFSTASPGE